MNKLVVILIMLGATSIGAAFSFTKDGAGAWQREVSTEIAQADQGFSGDLGVYVKRLSDGTEVCYECRGPWYLASTIKVFVGAAVLRDVERGKIRLEDKIQLRRQDFVDGSGEVIWKKPGERLSVSYLLEKMLTQSDSTATDILIRLVGVDELNRFVREYAPDIGPITTILQVRFDAYAEAHPKARRLTNMDFIAFKQVPSSQRLSRFARRIGVKPGAMSVRTLDDAFERYYARGMNSGSLQGFGIFIERLLTGAVLNAENTARIRGLMEAAVTGAGRIQTGLPKGYRFAQKTGTQVNRMCNVGLVTPNDGGAPMVVAACMKDFKTSKDGEAAFQRVGRALAKRG